MKNQKMWQLLIFLTLFILLCSVFTRSLTSSRTVYDYAQENPHQNTISSTSDEDELPLPQEITIPETTTEQEPPAMSSVEDSLAFDRVITANGFFYEPITPEIEERIRGISYPENDSDCVITLAQLSYVNVLYNDFQGETQRGEIICHHTIAADLVEIFYQLYESGYQFEQIALIDQYNGDDTLSMEHNNTSCFNYRKVEGQEQLSMHAYGLAIDINPFYNPYVVFSKDGSGSTKVSPAGSEAYADRSKDFPYKIDENDLCYQLFTAHGFTWGGNWNSSKDYQHFQKARMD